MLSVGRCGIEEELPTCKCHMPRPTNHESRETDMILCSRFDIRKAKPHHTSFEKLQKSCTDNGYWTWIWANVLVAMKYYNNCDWPHKTGIQNNNWNSNAMAFVFIRFARTHSWSLYWTIERLWKCWDAMNIIDQHHHIASTQFTWLQFIRTGRDMAAAKMYWLILNTRLSIILWLYFVRFVEAVIIRTGEDKNK